MSEVLVIGNKPFENIVLNDILDSFGDVYRCNMSLPNRNNGTKPGKLGLCSHLHDSLITNKLNENQFIQIYKNEYKLDEIHNFLKKYKQVEFERIFYAKPKEALYRKFLSDNNSPVQWEKMPRTGYTILFDRLIVGEVPFISNFSIVNEERVSYYVQKGKYESRCHSAANEITILRWLHKNKFVDASLCLLQDVKTPTFDCSSLMPNVEIIERALNHYEECLLTNMHSQNKAGFLLEHDNSQLSIIELKDKSLKVTKKPNEKK